MNYYLTIKRIKNHTFFIGAPATGKTHNLKFHVKNHETSDQLYIFGGASNHEWEDLRFCSYDLKLLDTESEQISVFSLIKSELRRRIELFKQIEETNNIPCSTKRQYEEISGISLLEIVVVVDELGSILCNQFVAKYFAVLFENREVLEDLSDKGIRFLISTQSEALLKP